MKKILFLGYNIKKTKLLNQIKNFDKNIYIKNYSSKINFKMIKNFDLVICYGYKHIIDSEILSKYKNKIINLHISYLPFNKGAHPNFWSFADNTPSGVTIHEIDKNLDSGKIIYQKKIDFNILKNKKKLNFENTYKILRSEVEKLFIDNIEKLLNQKFKSYTQIGIETYHSKKDLPKILKSWKQNIFNTITKYNKQKKLLLRKKIELINQVEKTRKNNNVNWMDLVRTSLKTSPIKTLEILKKINTDDEKISQLFKKINE